METISKINLFLELAKPDKDGISRWVKTTEFIGRYSSLALGNGLSWGRRNSPLRKKYIVEVKRDGRGSAITEIRLNGLNTETHFNQGIRQDIKEEISKHKCVMLGVNGKSENTVIEVDHKDGRKDSTRVSDPATQRIEDFQPLCKAANDIKRQICKLCKQTDKRWDAKNISGNPYSFYEGDENYDDKLGCHGCYQYDPVEYRKQSARRLSEEAVKHSVEYIMRKLYPETFEDK